MPAPGFAVQAIGDLNVWLPNMIGAILAVLQVLLRFRYGVRAQGAPHNALARLEWWVLALTRDWCEPSGVQDL